tara:strand:+ start:690 stop:881 length:192 start_codon:yes stop_codon:yes gene_type:complete
MANKQDKNKVDLHEIILENMKNIDPNLPPKTVKKIIKMYLPASYQKNKTYINMIFEAFSQTQA